MKKTTLVGLVAFFGLALPVSVLAYAWQTGNLINLPENETIVGNFYAAGSDINIDGDIAGDVFLAGQNITINGNVSGDVFAIGENIAVKGEIKSSLRAVGSRIEIDGKVGHSAMLLGAEIVLGQDAAIGWDMLFAGALANIAGRIGLDLHGGGGLVNISGEVGRDVKLRLWETPGRKNNGHLNVGDTALINGHLYYSAPREGAISAKAEIGGETGYSLPPYKRGTKTFSSLAWSGLISIFSLYALGLVLIALWRKELADINRIMLEKKAASFGFGFLIMVLTPLAVLCLLFTVIGIPLALILLAFWLAAMYVAKIIAGLMVGKILLERLGKKGKNKALYAMIVGVPLVWLAAALPLLGGFLSLAIIWWSLGGAWLYLRKTSTKNN